MLKLARTFEPILRQAGIDPNEVQDIDLQVNNRNVPVLTVKIQPRVEVIEIIVTTATKDT